MVRWTVFAVAGAAGLFVLAMTVLVSYGLCDHLQESDVGLVLGNKVEADGKPSAHLQARLDRALDLRRNGYFVWVIVSGGVEPDGHDEAAAMRDYLVAHGVPEDKIIVDSQGINTYESARFTVKVMRERKLDGVCVVTHYFHAARASLALDRFGANYISSGSTHYFEWRDLYSTAREVVAFAWYACRHYERPPHYPRHPEPEADH